MVLLLIIQQSRNAHYFFNFANKQFVNIKFYDSILVENNELYFLILASLSRITGVVCCLDLNLDATLNFLILFMMLRV